MENHGLHTLSKEGNRTFSPADFYLIKIEAYGCQISKFFQENQRIPILCKIFVFLKNISD